MNYFDIYNNEHVKNLEKALKKLRKQFNMVHEQFKKSAFGSSESEKLKKKLNCLNQTIEEVKSQFDGCVTFLKSLR